MMARTAASTSAAASRLVARKARKRSAKSAARRIETDRHGRLRGRRARPVNRVNGATATRSASSLRALGARRRRGPGRHCRGARSGRDRPVRLPGTRPRAAALAPPEKVRVTTPAGASVSSNSTASRLSTASLPCGSTLRHLQAVTRSKRSAVRRRRSSGCVACGRASRSRLSADHQPLLLRPPEHVGDLDHGILQMGRDDLEVVPVEGDELELAPWRALPAAVPYFQMVRGS